MARSDYNSHLLCLIVWKENGESGVVCQVSVYCVHIKSTNVWIWITSQFNRQRHTVAPQNFRGRTKRKKENPENWFGQEKTFSLIGFYDTVS